MISGSGISSDLITATAAPSSTSTMEKRAMSTTTQSSLYDFPFPVLKTWGSQRVLRCVKLQTSANADEDTVDPVPASKTAATAVDEGLDRVRAKLMVHFREATGKIVLAGSTPEKEEPETEVPWSLRTRRGTYNRPIAGGRPKSSFGPDTSPEQSLLPGRSLRLRSEDVGKPEMKRKKFSVVLSMEEIDEDLYSLTGKRASRRPKKRPRLLKKQIDLLFPGLYLSEVTPEFYEVSPPPPES